MSINEEITGLEIHDYKQKVLPTFVDVLSKHAAEIPNDTALVFLTNGEKAQPSMTFSELHELSMKFAAGIREHADRGNRVLLLFQSSYEFAVAFFGCLYAGVISIPLPIPSRRIGDWTRMEKIIHDTDAKLVVTYEKARERLMQNAQDNMRTTEFNLHLYEDMIKAKAMRPEKIKGSDAVFLQYTSGSTGAPKGVILSHDNLIENQIILKKGFRNHSESVYLSWLPLFHDMGLIGNFMQAIYIGQPFIFMAPNAFLQKPIRWLRAVSEYNVRVSGAPNFAYDLCVERIKEEDKEELDLSSWEVAFNGAEPVRADTLKKFSQAFKNCSFNEKAFYPCYGTAESTLIISGAVEYGMPVYLDVERKSYEQNKIIVSNNEGSEDSITLVSSGKPLIENSVVIVSPINKRQLPNLAVGEIWLNSPCNASGYWNNLEASEKTFRNKIEGDDSLKDYLNTGDLGFLDGENIYITGRTKDLLIFNGRNIYPQDIESCSSGSDVALKTGRCAATSLYIDGKERLVLIHELERLHVNKSNYDEVIENIRIAVYKEFSVPVFGVALVSPLTIPMTSSGKIRRQLCREQYKNNELNVVMSWSDSLNKS
ncbi:MAG: fatty acyl-AMP ligase [Candidatus Nitrotoga sp.]